METTNQENAVLGTPSRLHRTDIIKAYCKLCQTDQLESGYTQYSQNVGMNSNSQMTAFSNEGSVQECVVLYHSIIATPPNRTIEQYPKH